MTKMTGPEIWVREMKEAQRAVSPDPEPIADDEFRDAHSIPRGSGSVSGRKCEVLSIPTRRERPTLSKKQSIRPNKAATPTLSAIRSSGFSRSRRE
jgi:hypothetical protein